jgi:hypothetical protein
VEKLVFGDTAVALGQLRRTPLKLDELLHRLILARPGEAELGGVAVGLGILTECVEAAIAIAGPVCRLRIDLLEEAHNFLHRGKERVEVQSVETDPLILGL